METQGYHVGIVGPESTWNYGYDVVIDPYPVNETTWSEMSGGRTGIRRSVGFFETRGEAIKFARSVFGSMGYRVRY